MIRNTPSTEPVVCNAVLPDLSFDLRCTRQRYRFKTSHMTMRIAWKYGYNTVWKRVTIETTNNEVVYEP